MKEIQTPKKPMIFYYLIAMVALSLVNMLLYPALMRAKIQEVDYGSFLEMLEQGRIAEVELSDTVITFVDATDEDAVIFYQTGRIEGDAKLVDRLYEAGVVFGQVIPQENSPLLNALFSWVLPILLFVGIGQLMMRTMQKRMGGAETLQLGKSKAKVYVEAQTGKSFADVAGQEEAKEALQEIVDFLHNPGKYKEIGAQLPKGALLVGPPGTGKTLLAKAVAGEAKVPFFTISGSEFVEMFVGMGAARVRDLFKQAQEKAPCIVFIDEIDAIGKSRSSGMMGGNDEREQTLNQLLSEMDGFDGSKGVVILAATNRPETLDKALLRPGRFDRRIQVELPDLIGREAILQVHAKKIKAESNVNFKHIARSTSGASGAELANIINEAALRAVRFGRNLVTQSDLEESVETIIAGYQRKNAVLSDQDKLIVSYHEIGHALVSALQKNAVPVHKITIVPRTSGALGYTMQMDEEERVLVSKEEAMARIATMTGGRAAEALIFGSITTGASNDIEQATKLARAMVTRYGMSDRFGMMALETVVNPYLSSDATLTCSSETASAVDQEVKTIIEGAYNEALALLEANKPLLQKLAQHLLERETLTGEEFKRLLEE